MLNVGDKVMVKTYNIKGIITLKEGNQYHVKANENDSLLELPYRVFEASELGNINKE